MALPQMNLAEPLVDALVTLLADTGPTGLNATIDTLNASLPAGDPYKLDHIAQFLPYMAVPTALQGGLPAVCVQRLGGDFVDDLQTNTDAVHRIGVMAIIQNADQAFLARQLERSLQAIAYTIQQDRLAGTPMGTGSVMKTQGKAWAVNFDGYEPGPMLGEADPTAPDGPPRSFLSWDLLLISARRTEV